MAEASRRLWSWDNRETWKEAGMLVKERWETRKEAMGVCRLRRLSLEFPPKPVLGPTNQSLTRIINQSPQDKVLVILGCPLMLTSEASGPGTQTGWPHTIQQIIKAHCPVILLIESPRKPVPPEAEEEWPLRGLCFHPQSTRGGQGHQNSDLSAISLSETTHNFEDVNL